MTYTDGNLRSGSSSYPGGRYTRSGRSCGSPSGLPRSSSLLMTCSSMRPARSADQGSTALLPRGTNASAYEQGLPPAGRTGPRAARSQIEEDGLALALQPDVEPQLAFGFGHGDQRGPPGRLA